MASQFSIEEQLIKEREYWIEKNPDYALCINPNEVTGGHKKHKKKHLKGGGDPPFSGTLAALLCLKLPKVHPNSTESKDLSQEKETTQDLSPEKKPKTELKDLSPDNLFQIFKSAREQNEGAVEFLNKISVLSRDYLEIKNFLVDYVKKPKIEIDRSDLKYYITNNRSINVFSNFIEHVVKNCYSILENTSKLENKNGNLKVFLTTKFVLNTNIYNIVYKEFVFIMNESGNIQVDVKVCGSDYRVKYIKDDGNEHLIFDEFFNYSNLNFLDFGDLQRILPNYTKTGKILIRDVKKPIFAQVYNFMYTNDSDFRCTTKDIFKIIDNDYYIELPTNYVGLGRATFIYLPKIYRELKIDTNFILGKLREERELNVLFKKYEESIDINTNTQKPTSINSSEINLDFVPTPPQPAPFNFQDLFDVYFTEKDIFEIEDNILLHFAKEDSENLNNFIKTNLNIINNTNLTEDEKGRYDKVTFELKKQRKDKIMKEVIDYNSKYKD